MRRHKNVFELIGNTPLVELTNYENNHGLGARLIGKVEYFEPAGSIKDRIAKAMIDEAEANGLLDADTVIIEPTSGNTGIGLAAIAAARGNRIIIVMPDTMSVERRKLMRAYGAELVLTPGADGMKGAIAKAEELANEYPNSLIPSQFTNPANPAIHYRTTGRISVTLTGRPSVACSACWLSRARCETRASSTGPPALPSRASGVRARWR